MAMNFYDIFTGIGVGPAHNRSQNLVNAFSRGLEQVAVIEAVGLHLGNRAPAGKNRLQTGTGPWSGKANYADTAFAGRGCRGNNGIVRQHELTPLLQDDDLAAPFMVFRPGLKAGLLFEELVKKTSFVEA